MRIERFQPHPLTLAGLETQRVLSLARTPAELSAVMARRLREVAGVSHVIGVDRQGLGPGLFRVMYAADIRGELTPEDIDRDARWGEPLERVPVETSAVLGVLVNESAPVGARDVAPSEDAVVARISREPLDLLAVPVFYDGSITEWLVLGSPPGADFHPLLVAQAVNAMNLVSRGISQVALTEEVTALHARLDRQIREVGAVQRALLPRGTPRVPGYELATSWVPSESAGGDYYDFRRLCEDGLGIAIADVSGHGPAAAVGMAVVRTALARTAIDNRPAGTVLEDLNDVLYDGLGEGMFITALFVAIDPSSGEGASLCAGHPPPRRRRADGGVEAVPVSAVPPLGVMPRLDNAGHPFSIRRGETVVMYTDGITEAMGPSRELFGERRLDAAIASAGVGAEAVRDAVLDAVRSHEAGAPRADDQCLVVLHRLA